MPPAIVIFLALSWIEQAYFRPPAPPAPPQIDTVLKSATVERKVEGAVVIEADPEPFVAEADDVGTVLLDGPCVDGGSLGGFGGDLQQHTGVDDVALHRSAQAADRAVAGDPWHGPEVELVFDPYADPFEEYFEQEERVVERFVMRGPDDFSSHRHVASREGLSMARQLDAFEQSHPLPVRPIAVAMATAEPVAEVGVIEDAEAQTDGELDADMVVIEEDLVDHPADIHKKSIFAVRPGDYRSLFARLRRGDK